MTLPPPATGVEQYLAAIFGELRALRVAIEGGGQDTAADPAPADPTGPVSSMKRTRTRQQREASGDRAQP